MSVLYPVLLEEVVLDSSNNVLRYSGTFSGGAATHDVTLDAGSYFLSGIGDASDLLELVKDELNAAAAGPDLAATIAFKITDGAPLAVVTFTRSEEPTTLDFDAAQTTFDAGLLGFTETDISVEDTGTASTLTPSCLWVGNEPDARSDPGLESLVRQTRMTNGQVRTFDRGGPYTMREVELQLITAERTFRSEIAADPNRAFESVWRRATDGRRVQLHAVAVSSGTTLAALSSSTLVGTYVLDEATLASFKPRRFDPGLARYGWSLGLRGYVA